MSRARAGSAYTSVGGWAANSGSCIVSSRCCRPASTSTSYLDAEALRPILVAAGRRDGGEAVRELVAARNAELQRRFAASQSVAR